MTSVSAAPVDVALPHRLGLCLSGGGYRAAAFHLGTLRYLDEVGWLDRVTALSTVSGGSIIGAAWALSRARSEGFDQFFDQFHHKLSTVDLAQEAIRAFAATRPTAAFRVRGPSLARALAAAYRDHFGFDVPLLQLRLRFRPFRSVAAWLPRSNS